jgi:hypothetical protein
MRATGRWRIGNYKAKGAPRVRSPRAEATTTVNLSGY